METRTMVFGGTLLALALWACGGNSSAVDELDGGLGSGGGADASTRTGGATGTGGMSAQDLGQLFEDFLPDCDPKIAMEATCGGEECPMSPFLAAGLCEVPCCAERDGAPVCGTRNTTLGATTACVATPLPAQEDGRCAPAVLANTALPGCCTEAGVCGVVSPLNQTCITESMFVALPQPPPKCASGTPPVTDPDGYLPPDAGMPVDANTPDPMAEDAGMPVDEDAGWPVDEDAGWGLDEDGGWPMDEDAGMANDDA